jgi:hypothetical protein
MSDNIGHCPLCGGEKQLGTTTFAVDLKFGGVMVREVLRSSVRSAAMRGSTTRWRQSLKVS